MKTAIVASTPDELRAEALALAGNDSAGSSPPSGLAPLYVHATPKPPPRSFVVEGWIPEKFITYVYGAGGVFKSWVVLFLSISLCLGHSFANPLSIMPGGVLWLDWELDFDEFCRRARAIILGLGLDENEIPKNLAYLPLSQSIRDGTIQAQLRELIGALSPRLVVLDSYMAASQGGDSNANDDVAHVMGILRGLGCTLLVIDHTTKAAMSEKQLEATPIGGVMKWNLARSTIVVVSSGGAIILRHRKSNFGPLMDPIAFQFTFGRDAVTRDETLRIRSIAVDAPELNAFEEDLPANVRIIALLKREGSLSAKEITQRLETIPEKTVKNTLSILKSKDRVVPGQDGRWSAQSPESLLSKGIGTRDSALSPEASPELSQDRDSKEERKDGKARDVCEKRRKRRPRLLGAE
jgi:hypothetical protein